MRLICHLHRNDRGQAQSTVAPDSVPGTIMSSPQKWSSSSSVKGSPGLRSGDTQSVSLLVLGITDLNLFHSFLNSFRNNDTSGLMTGNCMHKKKG